MYKGLARLTAPAQCSNSLGPHICLGLSRPNKDVNILIALKYNTLLLTLQNSSVPNCYGTYQTHGLSSQVFIKFCVTH